MSDLIPRCNHGNIILGCPEESCDEQTVYLIEQETLMARWEERQQQEARRLVDTALGITEDTSGTDG